jgi:hypothetical protein
MRPPLCLSPFDHPTLFTEVLRRKHGVEIPFGACFHPISRTQQADVVAFAATFVVALSSMPTLSTAEEYPELALPQQHLLLHKRKHSSGERSEGDNTKKRIISMLMAAAIQVRY